MIIKITYKKANKIAIIESQRITERRYFFHKPLKLGPKVDILTCKNNPQNRIKIHCCSETVPISSFQNRMKHKNGWPNCRSPES